MLFIKVNPILSKGHLATCKGYKITVTVKVMCTEIPLQILDYLLL